MIPVALPIPPPPVEKPKKYDKKKTRAYQLTIEPPWMRDEMIDPAVEECEIHTPRPEKFAWNSVRQPHTKAAVVEAKEVNEKRILQDEPRVDKLMELVVDSKLLRVEKSTLPILTSRADVAKAQKEVWYIKEQIIMAKEELKAEQDRYNLLLEDLKTAWIAIDKIRNAIDSVFPQHITVATQTKDQGVDKAFPYIEA